ETVRRLQRRLDELAARAPRDPRGVPMTGAAGGLSGGLWAFRDARLLPGAEYVLDAVGFDRLARNAHFVVTGEGRLDEQTRAGKLVSVVAGRCRALGVACHAVVGEDGLGRGVAELGLASVRVAPTLSALVKAGRALASATA
ncbi:MAG TPA: glycerate kinase, partial [Gaiellaceae bacterium]|nr:glycerate kinase [Gaiellaceae bacterium]